jgi:predicted transcriptional regulator
MKNISNKKKNINLIIEAKKGPYFEQFSKEAKERISLGVEIYNARIALGISQQKLAKMTKTTQKMISNIESANIDIRFSTLNKLKKALNFKADNWARIYRFSIENKKVLYK